MSDQPKHTIVRILKNQNTLKYTRLDDNDNNDANNDNYDDDDKGQPPFVVVEPLSTVEAQQWTVSKLGPRRNLMMMILEMKGLTKTCNNGIKSHTTTDDTGKKAPTKICMQQLLIVYLTGNI